MLPQVLGLLRRLLLVPLVQLVVLWVQRRPQVGGCFGWEVTD